MENSTEKRKLQKSNGHYLDSGHLARILNVIAGKKVGKPALPYLVEETGLPLRHVRNVTSIGRAMGLIEEKKYELTGFGKLVTEYDIFLESTATLEYIHYNASTAYSSLVYYEVFNTLLPENPPLDYPLWVKYFQEMLKGKYTDDSLKDHLPKEIRFIIDAYTEKSFKKLRLLERDSNGLLYRLRYKNITPLILTAIIYDYCLQRGSTTLQVDELALSKGSPAFVFGMDLATLRIQLEEIHNRGWIRFERTHSLDQVRLKDNFSALSFLQAFYRDKEPSAKNTDKPGELFK